MRIKTQNYNDVTVVELQGEMTADFVEMFRETCCNLLGTDEEGNAKAKKQRPAANGIVLDMSKVGFVDSQGLERLLWLRDFCRQSECELKLAGLDENCSKILEITGLEENFDRYAELAEAVKSLA